MSQVLPNYIYRASIKKNGEQINYRNSKGQNVSYRPENKSDAVCLFTLINKYFTGKDPNITPQEQVQLRADLAKACVPLSGMSETRGHIRGKLDLYEGVDFVLRTFSDETSEGGKNITPNEVYQMFEMFHCWTEHYASEHAGATYSLFK